jgi:flagellar assembly protein FliH
MMSTIPKASLSAYQRWELASLAEAETQARESADDNAGAAANDTVDAGRAEEKDGYAAGYATGYATGCAEGHAQGLAAGHAEGHAAGHAEGLKRAEEERARIAALIPSIADNAAAHRQQSLDEILEFALAVSQQMIGRALAVRRELVIPIVGAALERLPQMSQNVQLALHPTDFETVRAFLADGTPPVACSLVADPGLTPGGCRVITEQCEVDATVETRWRRLVASLGGADEWLAQD